MSKCIENIINNDCKFCEFKNHNYCERKRDDKVNLKDRNDSIENMKYKIGD